jgi:uncharacterized protein
VTEITIRSDDGLDLEGDIDVPGVPRAAALICHAHPAMQGTMNSPLLLAVRDALVARDIAVLRFNFRGVGRSGGEFGTGIAEVADASGALGYLRDNADDVPIAVVGWSFGGAIAIRLTARFPDLCCCVAIAPATERKPGVTEGLPPAGELNSTVPTLVVVGSNDRQTPAERCRAWAEGAGARYVEIRAANHFFWAKYEPLVDEVTSFVTEHTGV